MKQYIGTKSLLARPMLLGEYNIHRGWTMPKDENPESQGYLVEYADGYQSWSPTVAFEMAYRSDGNFDFSHALFLLKTGHRVRRSGWNGKNMFLFQVAASVFEVDREPLLSILGRGTVVHYHSHIDMRTADGMIVPWLCSQTDMVANDWWIVPDA